MRLLLAALAGLALAVVPALAANHSVTASGTSFTPKTITIAPGDKVVWSNPNGGFHNVKFDDGGLEKPADPSAAWNEEVSRTFPSAGSFRYVCEAHEADGMVGTVVVQSGGQTTTQTTTTTTTTTTPSPSPTATAAPTATATPAPAGDPTVTVRLAGSRFTARTGVRLRITSDSSQTLTGTLRRAGRTVLRPRLAVRAGTRIVAIRRTAARRPLARGRYTLTLRAPGVRGLPVTLRFRVR